MRLIIIVLLSGNLWASKSLVPRDLDPLPCQAVAKALLKKWETQADWTRRLSSVPGKFSYNSPTQKFGEWVSLLVPDLAHTLLVRRTQHSFVRVALQAPDCVTEIEYDLDRTKKEKNVLDDSFLLEYLKREKQGVIYLWSPKMVLSIKTLEVMKKVAKKMGLAFLVGVDPNGSKVEVKRVLKAKNWPKEYGKKWASFDLMMRHAGDHYPTSFVFKDGMLLNSRHPGAELEEEGFKNFIEAAFKKDLE